MNTTFDEIYSLNGALMDMSEQMNKPDNIYYFILFQYLYFAISEFSQHCYKDLSNHTPFSQNIYTFEDDGIETQFVLSPTPEIDSQFYVNVDGVKLKEDEYSYDDITNTLTLSVTGNNIYVGTYIVGTFNIELNMREKTILADAMTPTFVEKYINTPKQLEQLMYEGVEMFSQSQHNKVSISIEEFRRSKCFRDMIYYSYGRDMPSTVSLAKKSRN